MPDCEHSVPSDYVLATYLLEDKRAALSQRAEGIAVGLTVGSWTDLPATKQTHLQAFCGLVEGISVIAELEGGRVRAEVTIAYPSHNLTATLSSLLTTVFGKLSMDGKIKLLKLQIPDDFARQFPGPKHGVAGIRQRLGQNAGQASKPLVMSIFKSCVGQPLRDLTTQFEAQALGCVDFIKDDEIFFREDEASPEQRVEAFGRIANKTFEVTGKRVQYAVNLTGPIHSLLHRARTLSQLGAGALLFNAFAYGYDVLCYLAADAEVTAPIMVHPAVAGALYAAPDYGFSAAVVLGQLLRLAGADIVIYPSPYGSVTLPQHDGLALVEALRQSSVHKPCLPAPSAGIHPGLVPLLVRDYGTDVIVNAGGGISGHPAGAMAGGLAFKQAIDATLAGINLNDAAEEQLELSQAIAKWGVQAR